MEMELEPQDDFNANNQKEIRITTKQEHDKNKKKEEEELETRQLEFSLEAENEEQHSEFCFTSFLVKHPFLVHLIMLLSTIGVTLFSFLAQDDPLMTELFIRSIMPDGPNYKYAENYRAEMALRTQSKNELTKTFGPQYAEDDDFVMMWELNNIDESSDSDPWILTPENFYTIIKWENEILNHDEWLNTCHLYANRDSYGTSGCLAPVLSLTQTIKNVLIPTYGPSYGISYDTLTTSQLKLLVKLALGASPSATALFDDSILTNLNNPLDPYGSTLTAKRYRSIFGFGLTYPTTINNSSSKSSEYVQFDDRTREQRQKYHFDNHLWKLFENIDVDGDGSKTDGDLKLNSYGTNLWLEYTVYIQFTFIIPFLFIASAIVLVYASFDIGSVFLSIAAFWEIVVTIPWTYFIYKYICGAYIFGFMQLSVYFILFAVGVYYYPAYVFVDHWLHTRKFAKNGDNFKLRMAIAWKESAKAAGVAQSTTFLSFLSAIAAPLALYRSFGLFAAIAIFFNYFMGILLYPCSIIIWEKYIRPLERQYYNFMKNHNLGYLAPHIQESYYSRLSRQNTIMSVSRRDSESSFNQNLSKKSKSMHNIEKHGKVDVGFGLQSLETLKREYRTFGVWIGVYWTRYLERLKYLIYIIFMTWIGIALWSCTKIEKLEEPEAYHGDNSYMTKSQLQVQKYAPTLSDRSMWRLTFGVNGLKSNSRNPWSDEDFGEPSYYHNDNGFDISTISQQQWLLDLSTKINDYRSISFNEGLAEQSSHIDCWVDSFKLWLNTTYPGEVMPVTYDANDPTVQQQTFYSRLYEWYHTTTTSAIPQLATANTGVDSLNGFLIDIQKVNNVYVLKHFIVKVSSIYSFWSNRSIADRDEINHEEFLLQYTTDCESTLGSQDESDSLCKPIWNVLKSAMNEGYDAYFASSIDSVAITLPIVFGILCMVLDNWIMSFLCCCNVFGIMISVLSCISFFGWKFGLIESLSVVLVLGFSVDYSVHISHGYLSSPLVDSRRHQCQYSLLTNGHAIISSGFVSILSLIPLLFDDSVIAYWKAGILTLFTLLFSILFCFTIFTLILQTFAPQNGQGKISPLIKKFCPNLFNRFTQKPTKRIISV